VRYALPQHFPGCGPADGLDRLAVLVEKRPGELDCKLTRHWELRAILWTRLADPNRNRRLATRARREARDRLGASWVVTAFLPGGEGDPRDNATHADPHERELLARILSRP